jgi:hypothetical protein
MRPSPGCCEPWAPRVISAFATTLGHPYRNFQQEAFRRMIVNGILWAAQVEVPREGAPVQLPPEVLALPPAPK